jgi:Dolichyl-phosphate-mannose-protein mannosyltransferase
MTRAPKLWLGGICVFVVCLGVWNVLHYPPGEGYDAAKHMAYADGLIPGLHFPPKDVGEYYSPPGYYAVAGTLGWVAKQLGIGAPDRAGMAANILFLLGTVVLVWRIARELWPGRDRPAIAATAFVALSAVAVKTEAMFYPETLALFFVTLALWCCLRTFSDRRYAFALGIALGAAQLVHTFALWAVPAALAALLVGRRWREAAIVLCFAALIPAPWYIHQTIEYGTPLPFNVKPPAKPVWERQPLRFYVDPDIPQIVTAPYRPHQTELFVPTLYTEMWGDYYGAWVWEGHGKPPAPVRHELQLQALVGLLPTLLAIGGWLLLLGRSLRSPPRLSVALLPLLGILGYLYFAVSYPTDDGDTIKATYMLTTIPGWALGFGYALERLRGRYGQLAVALLALCTLAELPFLVWGAHWDWSSLW